MSSILTKYILFLCHSALLSSSREEHGLEVSATVHGAFSTVYFSLRLDKLESGHRSSIAFHPATIGPIICGGHLTSLRSILGFSINTGYESSQQVWCAQLHLLWPLSSLLGLLRLLSPLLGLLWLLSPLLELLRPTKSLQDFSRDVPWGLSTPHGR